MNDFPEAKRLHNLPGDQKRGDTHGGAVAGALNPFTSQTLSDTQSGAAGGGPT